MKCPNCKSSLRKVNVSIEGTEQKVLSYQCPKCDYFSFDKESGTMAANDLALKEAHLKIRQKIVNLSQGRLGLYFNKNVVESLHLKAGEEIQMSIPEKDVIILKILKSL